MPDPQNLTNPDEWMARKSNPQGLTNPDEWMQQNAGVAEGGGVKMPRLPGNAMPGVNVSGKRQKPVSDLPKPPDPGDLDVGSGRKLGMLPTAPEAVDFGRSLLDPEAIGGMAGGMIAGPLGAGAGAATGNIINQEYNRMRNPQVGAGIPDLTPAAGAFATGALAEGLTRGISGNIRRPVTPAGQMASDYFGRSKTMAQQMVDSPVLDFAATVAKYGPGGKQVMTDAEREQSTIALEKLRNASHTFSPSITIDPATQEFDKGVAGQQLQSDLAGQVKAAPKQSGYTEFFEKHGKRQWEVPNVEGTDTVKVGPTVREAHQARSEDLAYGRGQNISRADRQAAVASAAKNKANIERALPDDAARQEYTNISNKYHQVIERIDNPTAEALRTGPSDNVINNILGNKLQNYENLSTGTGHTNTELLTKIKSAASPQAWQQLQADTIHQLGQRSIDAKTGMVDVKAMKDIMDGMDNGVKNTLFGNQLPAINQTIKALTQAGKYKESEAGRLFIAIRTGQAGIRLAGAATAAGAGLLGYETGHPLAGAVGASTIIVSPYLAAKLLTSEVGRTLLTRAAKGGMTESLKAQTIKGLLRFGTQQAGASAVEAFSPESDPNQDQGAAQYKPDNYIPEPPR